MTDLTIVIDDKALKKAFAAAPAMTKAKLIGWRTKTALMVEREAKIQIRPHIDTGQAQSSIHTILRGDSAVVKPTAKHAEWIIKGRRPGSKMPPFQPGSSLNRWATKRGMTPFLVARSIARKGIKSHPFMDTTYRIVKPQAERDGRTLLNEIVRAI